METTKPDNILSLENVLKASSHTLRKQYQGVFGHAPPIRASIAFMRGNVAWAAQVKLAGKKPETLRKQCLRKASVACSRDRPIYTPGTRLVREWQGEVYEVTILTKGYRWRGKEYRSLTQIALEITGAKWSGPRFFGMRAKNNG